jgi:hypothetical protein
MHELFEAEKMMREKRNTKRRTCSGREELPNSSASRHKTSAQYHRNGRVKQLEKE